MSIDGTGEHPPGQDPPLPAAPRGGAAPGAMRGQITLPDDFDAPLDDLFKVLR